MEKDFRFCPYCGASYRREKDARDYGLLGRDDEEILDNINLPFGLNGLFNMLVGELGKQLKELDNEKADEKIFRKGIRINISSADGNPIIKFGELTDKKPKPPKKSLQAEKKQKFDAEKLNKIKSLPKKEPETNVRRLSNKLVYEIDLPGVKSVKDIIINKLENSIEIKAISKKIVYVKTIPINLPLLRYGFKKEKLVLELKPKN